MGKSEPRHGAWDALFDLVSDGLIVYELKGEVADRNCVRVNPAICSMLGYTAEEMRSLAPSCVEDGKKAGGDRLGVEKLLSENSMSFETMLRRKNGTTLPAEVSSRIFHYQDRTMVLSSIKDLTGDREGERRPGESEAILTRARQAAQAHERYARIIDTSLGGFWITDMKGRFLDVNDAYCRMSGYAREELLSMSLDDAEAIESPADILRHIDLIRKNKADHFTSHHRRKDGSIVDLEVRAAYLDAGGGEIVGFAQDVTERNRIEKALRSSEEAAAALMNTSWDSIFLIDPAGTVLAANAASAARHGIEPSAMIGRCIYDLLPPDLAAARKARTEQTVREGKPVRFEDERAGRTYDIVEYPICSESGKVVKLVIHASDITERKETEDALRRAHDELERRVRERTNELVEAYRSLQQSEARYRDLYEQANDMIFTTDLRGNITTANAKTMGVLARLGLPAQGISLEHVLAPDVFTRVVALMGGTLRKDSDSIEEQPWEFRAQTKDGEPVFLEVKARLMSENGVTTGLHAIARDITQRKKLEEEQVRLSSAVEHAGEGVFMMTPDRRYSYVNAAHCRMFGFTREELLGRSPAITRSGRHPESFHDSIYSSIQAGNTWSGHQTRQRKDGELVEVETTIAPIRDKSGEIIHYVGVERDITEQLRIEQQLRQSQKMQAVGTLAGGIAHDFNNMLAIIIGNAELALDDIHAEAPRNNLGQILMASERARDLTKQILTFSRKTERGKNALKLTPLLRETYKLLRGTIPTTIRMELNIRTKADTVLAEPSQVQQVLINLATNAAFAMRERGGLLVLGLNEVMVGQKHQIPGAQLTPGTYLELTVRDTGAGMPQEVSSRIFEPFFTTKGPGEGTGMGLAVVYGIVKNQGGEVIVESNPGRGSIFRVFLPRSELSASAPAEEQSRVSFGNKERILLVDDEPVLLQTALQTLQRFGYSVTTADGGVQAWQVFEKAPDCFDLVMTDQVMPDLTGIDLAEMMLKTRKDLPIILLTGYSETVTREKARAAGIREFIMKPINKTEMAQAIRRVLEQKENKE